MRLSRRDFLRAACIVPIAATLPALPVPTVLPSFDPLLSVAAAEVAAAVESFSVSGGGHAMAAAITQGISGAITYGPFYYFDDQHSLTPAEWEALSEADRAAIVALDITNDAMEQAL